MEKQRGKIAHILQRDPDVHRPYVLSADSFVNSFARLTPLSFQKPVNGIVFVTNWSEGPRWGLFPSVCFSGNEEFQ